MAAAAMFTALSSAELKSAKEIVKSKLYFLVAKTLNPRANDTATQHYFSIDTQLLYGPFFTDFGPLNLGCTYRFCMMLRNKLKDPKLKDKVIYFYCSSKPQHKANAACLIALFQVLYLNKTALDAYKPLKSLEPFLPFRDASMGPVTFRLTIPHVLNAVLKAQKHRFFDFTTFNADEYEFFEAVENGDLNIIVPGKFLAFSGPHATKEGEEGYPALTPEDYVPVFKKYGVQHIVRLNKKCYERERFTNHGFQHYDLFFNDGTPPPPDITEKFLHICENTTGTIAIHCKAGLGRTGSLIGCYLLKHHHFTAAEAIAWIRVCRPGSIIGPQQQFLKQQEARLWKAGGKPGTGSTGSAPGSANGSAQTTPEKAGTAADMKSNDSAAADVNGTSNRIAQLTLESAAGLPNTASVSTPKSNTKSVAAPTGSGQRASVSGVNGGGATRASPSAVAAAAVYQTPLTGYGSPVSPSVYSTAGAFKPSPTKTTPPGAKSAASHKSNSSPKSGGNTNTPPSAARASLSGASSGVRMGAAGVSSPSAGASTKLVNSYMTTASPAGAAPGSVKRSPASIATASGAAAVGRPASKSVGGGSPAGVNSSLSLSQPLGLYSNTAAQLAASPTTSAPTSPAFGVVNPHSPAVGSGQMRHSAIQPSPKRPAVRKPK